MASVTEECGSQELQEPVDIQETMVNVTYNVEAAFIDSLYAQPNVSSPLDIPRLTPEDVAILEKIRK